MVIDLYCRIAPTNLEGERHVTRCHVEGGICENPAVWILLTGVDGARYSEAFTVSFLGPVNLCRAMEGSFCSVVRSLARQVPHSQRLSCVNQVVVAQRRPATSIPPLIQPTYAGRQRGLSFI